MKRGYDVIAGVYDLLAKVFIGKALRNAQLFLITQIPPRAKVLIAGGGTGWILEEITVLQAANLTIDYIDSSAKMIARSKLRNTGENKIRFLHQSVLEPLPGDNYDVIITPFFLDNFLQETAENIFEILSRTLNSNGLWLYADFQVNEHSSRWQKAMLFTMYAFFRMVCAIEARQLPDVATLFDKYGYKTTTTRFLSNRFIVASVYQRSL